MNISVIIPAYNCRDYIEQTVNSVLAQTLTDFEIIIVNDGSTDDTLDVLNALKQKDTRINVYTTKNNGPARARNVGINWSLGEYLFFLDSDDTIAPTCFEDMYCLGKYYNLDVITCGYDMISNNGSTAYTYESFIANNNKEFRERLMPLIKSHLMYVVWNKLYKRDFLKANSIHFEDYLSGEDRLFNIATFPHIERFAMIEDTFYKYNAQNSDTLANRYVKNRLDATMMSNEALIDCYKSIEMYDDNRQEIDFIFIKGIVGCLVQLHSKDCPFTKKQKKRYVRNLMKIPDVKFALLSTDEDYFYSKIVNKVLKTKNYMLISIMTKRIFNMQRKNNKKFLSMKRGKN